MPQGVGYNGGLSLLNTVPFTNVAQKWTAEGIRQVAFARYGPDIAARALAILSECMWDAWVAVSGRGTPSVGPKVDRHVPDNAANRNTAVAYASRRALQYIFGDTNPDVNKTLDDFLQSQGYDISITSESNPTAAGVGIQACNLAVKDRAEDGVNSKGTNLGAPPVPYADYTNYREYNPPMPEIGKTDCSKLVDVNSWQPARVRTAFGATTSRVQR